MLKDFKEFALKGNVMDLAIGVIIGGAFGKIVTSLVNDIIMPLLGMLTGGISFSDLKIVLSPAEGEIAEVALCYGNFIQTTIDFVIIAFCIFMFVKILTKFTKKKEEKAADPKPSNEEVLLTEIRDLLKNQSPS